MSGKKELKSEISRKSDKTIDIHREYLDMDTDEEDFGRQESPEVEEELPPEPEKPVFSEEDLIILVHNVKDLTIFPASESADWNENCDELIREYFENPSHVMLTIFHTGNKLTVDLGLPNYAPKGFVYFLRSPWQIYTPENFFSTISFGSVTKDIKNSVLRFIENMYAPIVLRNNSYTPFIQNEIYSNLHELLIRLIEEIYKPLGLTTLYVPKESIPETFLRSSDKTAVSFIGESNETALSDENERKRKLIGRLENVVWSWIKQMYKPSRINIARTQIQTIYDEVNYWTAKYSNLKYLQVQIANSKIESIIETLKNVRSLNANKFQELAMNIKIGLKEASSNLKYLNVFFDFCKTLNVPDDVENSITEALFLILFIWMESSFYKRMNKIGILCQTLSLQIIYQCRKYINLDVAFGSNPEEGIKMLKKCIICCNTYEIIYNNIITSIISYINPDKKWEINREEVFDSIETFKQRCYDVIEICEALIIFGRCNKMGLLGSPRGIEYEAYWREIEHLFYKSLNEIILVRDIIFEITKFNWLRKIKQFRYTVQQLENMVINLINDIFKYVKNIEEGIEAIYALQKLMIRESFRELLHNKWLQIWNIFNNEIEFCYINAIGASKRYDQHIKRSDNVNLLCISQYLKSQYSVIMNALDWIGDCPIESSVVKRYKHVLDVIDVRRKMFNTYNAYRTQ
ncbi:uncharacterized protein LOC143180489 [Calliopsis andreniformis]|uniref:uncharacterized protein LOC143180489 n=1 Tax=Calliopsis andreniformis TaxID=337506 RepID=UPI003FCE4D5D